MIFLNQKGKDVHEGYALFINIIQYSFIKADIFTDSRIYIFLVQ